MNNISKKKIAELQKNIAKIGINIEKTQSLIKFLYLGIDNSDLIKNSDLENIISVVNVSMQNIIKEQSTVENMLEM